MASISKISMLITANASKFNAPLGVAVNTLNLFNRSLNQSQSQIANFRGIISAFGGYLAVRFIAGIIESNIETLEFSKRIGTAASEVSALDFAIMQTGHPIESMREGLQDLSLQLAKLSRGDIVVADMFNQIGLTAEQLRNKNPAEVFTMIAHRIRQIEDPARQAGAAVRIFGKEAIHLLPLLQSGAVGIGKAMEKAKNLGLLVDNEKLEKLKEGSIALSNIRKALDGIVLQLATNLAPVFGTLIQLLDKWIGKLDFEKAFAGVQDVILNVITFFIQMKNAAIIVVANIRKEFVLLINDIKVAIKEAAIALAELQGADKVKIINLKGERMELLAKQFKDAQGAGGIADRMNKEINAALNDPLNAVNGVKKWFDAVNLALRVGRVAFAKENKAINVANVNEKFFEQAGKMAEQTLQPLEVFQQKIRDIQELMEKTGESKFLQRSQLEAMNQLASSLGADQSRLAGADLRGSASAVSAFNQSRFEREVKTETPAKRLERLQKEGTASLKNIEKYSEETSKALKDIKQVAIP